MTGLDIVLLIWVILLWQWYAMEKTLNDLYIVYDILEHEEHLLNRWKKITDGLPTIQHWSYNLFNMDWRKLYPFINFERYYVKKDTSYADFRMQK